MRRLALATLVAFTVAAVAGAANGRPVAGTPKGLLSTVPRLFRRIQQAITSRVAGIRVRYGRYGVPRSISIDPSARVADEQSGYGVSKFQRLK